jgi:hypothetical protein
MKTTIKLLALLVALLCLFVSCNDKTVTTDDEKGSTPLPSAGASSDPSKGETETLTLPSHIRYCDGAYYFYPPFTNKELDTHDDEFAANAVFSVKSMEELHERLVKFGPDVTKEQLYFFKVCDYLPGVGYKMPYANLLNDDFYTLPSGTKVKDISWLQGSECVVQIELSITDGSLGSSAALSWASYPEIVETKEHFLDAATKACYGENPTGTAVTVNGQQGIKLAANNLYPADTTYYVTEKEGVTYFVTIVEMGDTVQAVQVDRYASSGRYSFTVLQPLPQTVARCVELDPFTPGEPIVLNEIEAPRVAPYPDVEHIPALAAPKGLTFTRFNKGNLGFLEWVIDSYAKDFAHAEGYSAFWQASAYSLFEESYFDDFYHRHEYAERLNAQNIYHGCGNNQDGSITMAYSFMEPNTETGTTEKVSYSIRYYTVGEGQRTYYLKEQVRDKDRVCTLFTVQYVENGQLFGYTAEMPDGYYVEHFSEFDPFK